MFYEIEMLPDNISGIINTLHDVDNRENLSYHFTYNMSEAFDGLVENDESYFG